MQACLTAGCSQDGIHQRVGGDILEQVAGGAGLYGGKDLVVFIETGQGDDFYIDAQGFDLAGG